MLDAVVIFLLVGISLAAHIVEEVGVLHPDYAFQVTLDCDLSD